MVLQSAVPIEDDLVDVVRADTRGKLLDTAKMPGAAKNEAAEVGELEKQVLQEGSNVYLITARRVTARRRGRD